MVITALTRNQVGGNASWVRIPPPPPNKHRNLGIKITVLIFVYMRKNQVLSIFLCEIQSRCGVDPQRLFLSVEGLPYPTAINHVNDA